MPELLDDLRLLGGPDRPPSDDARQHTLRRLQREIDDELAPARSRRLRPRLIAGAATALAFMAAAIAATLPASGPGALRIVERAAAAVMSDHTKIVVADIHAEQLRDGKATASYGTTRVWARQVPGEGTREFRSLQLDAGSESPNPGDEVVSFPSPSTDPDEMLPFTTEQYLAAENTIVVERGTQSNIGRGIFEARSLLARARRGETVAVDEVTLKDRPAYKLTWREDTSRAPTPVTVELTLWVDRETYVPLQFTDHGYGTDPNGRPFDQTYKATISGFRTLSDTQENRALLTMSPHPSAKRVTPDQHDKR